MKNSERGEPVWRLSAWNETLENLGRPQYKSRVTTAGELGGLLSEDKDRTVSLHSKEGTHTVLYLLLLSWGQGQLDCSLTHTTTENRVSPPCLLRLTHQSPQETPKRLYLGNSPIWTRGPKPPPTYSCHTFTCVLFILFSFPSSGSQPRSEASEQSSTRSPAAWPSSCSTR